VATVTQAIFYLSAMTTTTLKDGGNETRGRNKILGKKKERKNNTDRRGCSHSQRISGGTDEAKLKPVYI